MLFCGPSGVGKTLLAKTFGNYLTKNSVIKIDCSEFKEPHSISKIIGSPPGYVGYDETNTILEKIKNNPNSVLILDEIEKAHSNFISLFLQVLDEGIMKNSKGQIIRFDNVVIIMTSNIGYLNSSVGFNINTSQTEKLNESFSIPFMNRVDNLITFNRLTEENIRQITEKEIKQIKKKYKTKVKIKVSKKVIDDIVEISNYKTYGARKIKKIIKDKLESIIIDTIIEEKPNIYIKELIQKA